MGKIRGNTDKKAVSLSSNNIMQNTNCGCVMVVLYKIFNFENRKESSQPISIK